MATPLTLFNEDGITAYTEGMKMLPLKVFEHVKKPFYSKEVEHRLAVLIYEMSVFWGKSNINIFKKRIKRAYEWANKEKNVKDRLAKIEEYLNIIGYYEKKNEQEERLKKTSWKSGIVYILTNIYMPKLIKVGMVYKEDKTVDERARELNSTGVPYPFDIKYRRRTIDSKRAEEKVHNCLAKRWEKIKGKEFFVVPSTEEAIKIVDKAIDEVEKELYNRINTADLFSGRNML